MGSPLHLILTKGKSTCAPKPWLVGSGEAMWRWRWGECQQEKEGAGLFELFHWSVLQDVVPYVW